MNQQRLQSYINLIQKLLACPSGEEWILLRDNEALVTPELVQVMEQVATQLANQGNRQEAKFLHNLAGQLHHLFVAQTVKPAPQDEGRSQAYLELIQSLLECPKGSEGELLAKHQELIGPGLVQMMQQVAAQFAAEGDQETANYLRSWGTELNRLWVQQHDFQPFLSKGSEPQPFPAAAPASPPKVSAPPTPEAEDFWGEEPSEPEVASTVPPSPLRAEEKSLEEPISVEGSAPPRDGQIYEQIEQHLATIARALTVLSEKLAPPQPPPTPPLWYMEILERACVNNWLLTSTEIKQLTGVEPTCPKGSESFGRGGWVFVKAGKVGNQLSWRVQKAT